MANYTEKYTLPTMGLLNPEIPNGEIVIRNMTTTEEKMLLGSTQDAFDKILKNCIEEPKEFNLDELCSSDKHFILMKLRVISYGSTYFVSYPCPTCGKISEYKINLDDLPVNYLNDDFVEPYDLFELPICKKTIEVKIPRIKDIEMAETKARRYHKKFPEALGDMSYIYKLMTNIYSVDGEEVPFSKLQSFIEELHTTDTAYLKHKINKFKVGYDTNIVEECPKCESDVDFALPITYEFFRTRFDD